MTFSRIWFFFAKILRGFIFADRRISEISRRQLKELQLQLHLKGTEFAIKNKLKKLLTELREFKFVTTLVLVFKKVEVDDKTKYDTFYSNSKAELIINESDSGDVFQSIYITIISNIQKSLRQGSGWIIDSVIEHNISILKYNHQKID